MNIPLLVKVLLAQECMDRDELKRIYNDIVDELMTIDNNDANAGLAKFYLRFGDIRTAKKYIIAAIDV